MRGAADDALLAACATGDADAAATFVRRHQARVYGLALAIVGEPGVAEEVARETFLRAWSLSPAYDPRRCPVGLWLLTLTRALALDAMRMCQPAPVADRVLDAFGAGSGDGTGDDAGHRAPGDPSADRSRLLAALDSLSESQRRALAMAVLGGRSVPDIAEAEGVVPGTARARLRSGLLRLRSVLASPRGRSGE